MQLLLSCWVKSWRSTIKKKSSRQANGRKSAERYGEISSIIVYQHVRKRAAEHDHLLMTCTSPVTLHLWLISLQTSWWIVSDVNGFWDACKSESLAFAHQFWKGFSRRSDCCSVTHWSVILSVVYSLRGGFMRVYFVEVGGEVALISLDCHMAQSTEHCSWFHLCAASADRTTV